MKKPMTLMLWLAIVSVLALSACDSGSPPATKPAGPSLPMLSVTGNVTYVQRTALPASAVVEVQLQDVSLADASAAVINTQTINAQGKQVPFAYELPFRPRQIYPKHTYSVRATIKDGDKLLFTSTQAYPVITNGAPLKDVEIIVEPVP